MKRYESKFFEMANIGGKYTSITEGIIQIRPGERHKNFPHIHYIHNIKKADNEYIKFSINKDIEKIKIIEEHELKISKKEKEKIVTFISKNANKLIKYYKQAEILDTIDLLTSLEKI